jgi:hypothetical protein
MTDIHSYLNVRYGLVWTDLKNLQVPLRVGDVVILPGKFMNILIKKGTHPLSLDSHLEWVTLGLIQNHVCLLHSLRGIGTND